MTKGLLTLLLLSSCLIASSLCIQEDEHVDWIVVGGGSAACLNARRASEHGSVLLLERGGMIPEDDINAKWLGLLLQNWQPPYARDNLVKKDPPLNRRDLMVADTLGGGGMINGAISHTGSRSYWESLQLDVWDYHRHIIPAYDRLKQRLSLMISPYIPEIASWFVSSGANVSFVNDDLNDLLSTPTEGFGNIYLALKTSASLEFERDSTLYAYLNGSSGVRVSLSSHVTRINFDRKNEAKSVEYIKDGKVFTAKARKGIILSAGAIGSAEILLRSGVGPCRSLEALGIECISDLPVGQNLRDHHTIQLTYYTPCLVPSNPGFRFSPGTQVAGFIKSSPSRPYPDIQYTFSPYIGVDNFFLLTIFLVDAETRGNVTLASSDPLKPSIISYDYSGTPYDVQRLVDAIHTAEGFMSTPPFSACLGPRVSPSPTQDLPSWISSTSSSGYHPTGTLSLKEVVNPYTMEVMGVKGLYALDSSIIPLSNCNTQIPTLIAAERGMDLIIGSAP